MGYPDVMRTALCILGLSAAFLTAAPAAACDPTGGRLDVFSAGDGFVFVHGEGAERVSMDGTPVRHHALPPYGRAYLLSDGRTLLYLSPTDEEGPEPCLAARYRLQLLDTVDGGRRRRIGVIPSRGRSVQIERVEVLADGRTRVLIYVASTDEYEEVLVDPSARSMRTHVIAALPPEVPTPAGLGVRSVMDSSPLLEVYDASGRVRVTVSAAADASLVGALSADGRYLAVGSYTEINEDWGTGTGGRLEVVDLQHGTRAPSFGSGTGIARVQGTLRVRCVTRVNDPASPLHVRASPGTRWRVVADLPHGASVEVAERRGRWARVAGAVAGWVFAERLERSCRADL